MKPLAFNFLLVCTLLASPNILVIMVDDMGYSDLSCFGSEIETPQLDALAAGGLRFSQFYNTAKCHSSRVSLLTGQYCIAAGDSSLKHGVTSAEVLGKAGYFTAMSGKWHLKKQPTDFGFQRYFGHLSGACNFFKGDKSFRLNGEPWQVPSQGFYTTVAKVDFALKFLTEARQEAKPWYLYVAFNAPHAPLHALPADYAKYKGAYKAGWDVMRGKRVARLGELGLLPDARPSPRPAHVPAWDSLEPARQEFEANRMATLAAMIDRVDQEVGRLVADLRANGELENTLILFVSDNGACPYDRRSAQLGVEPTNGDIAFGDSTGWSWARNSPFRYYKQNQYEGGISSPAVLHWPSGTSLPAGGILHTPVHLIDVLPTVAEIAKAKIPNSWPDRELRRVSGRSFAPLLAGQPWQRMEPLHFLFSTDRALRDGDWKAVSFRSQAWELFNIREDRCETTNLAATEPERLQAMVARWTEMTRDLLHAPAKAYGPVSAGREHRHPEWTNFAKPLKARTRKGATTARIRARKDTKLTIAKGQLLLDCRGTDSGLAFDQLNLPKGSVGPYRLSFRLKSQAAGDGELYFTTDVKTKLPAGGHVPFAVVHDNEWHDHSIAIPSSKLLYALRFDPCSEPGIVRIVDLKLSDANGKTIAHWPTR